MFDHQRCGFVHQRPGRQRLRAEMAEGGDGCSDFELRFTQGLALFHDQ